MEASFEQGVLRPIEPLSLPEKQHVLLTVTELPEEVAAEPPAKETYDHREAEMKWIGAHSREYAGQWVALNENGLVSHGPEPRRVLESARAKGVERPLMYHVPEEPDDLPSAGWW